jgi:hypothetical protein
VCRSLVNVYYNICYMKDMALLSYSERCINFFVLDYNFLSPEQQLYFCQRYSKILNIASVCYNFDQANDFL